MKAIYSCKLYRSSNRKSKIQAAISDPLNLELVTQLKSYLDDEYQQMIDAQEAKERASSAANLLDSRQDSDLESTGSDQANHSGPSGGFGGPVGGRPSLSEKFDMLLSDEDADDVDNDLGDRPDSFDEDVDDNTNEGHDSGMDEIEESTTIEGIEEINSSSTLDLPNEVKQVLNSDEVTKGVNRTLLKKNELWVHYSDDINLNNVMGPVIEKLSTPEYDYLAFNRLARSENAIVFQVNSAELVNEEELYGI